MERPVFVLSSGRCGSTLLQRLLNSNPRFAIAGEHGGVLRGLSESYFGAIRLKAFQNNVTGRANSRKRFAKNIRTADKMVAWENFFDEAEFQEAYRSFIRTLFCFDPALRWGFKEIAYGVRDEVPEMLRALFPRSAFVVLLRHPVNVVMSKAAAFPKPRGLAQATLEGDGDKAARFRSLLGDYARNWGKLYDHLLAFAAADPQSLVVRYEDLVGRDGGCLAGLEDFLGEGPFAVDKVLGHRVNVGESNPDIRRLASQVLREDWTQVTAAVGAVAARTGYRLDPNEVGG